MKLQYQQPIDTNEDTCKNKTIDMSMTTWIKVPVMNDIKAVLNHSCHHIDSSIFNATIVDIYPYNSNNLVEILTGSILKEPSKKEV